MSSSQEQFSIPKDTEEYFKALEVIGLSVIQGVFRTAVELNLFEIMVEKAGPGGYISPSEIASYIPTQNPEAPEMLDRMLRHLACNSILTCKLVKGENGHPTRLYALAPFCKYFTRNENGVSLLPTFLSLQDQVMVDAWHCLKDAVIEGGVPFVKAHGMQMFDYIGKDNRFNGVFNASMTSVSKITMGKIVDTYQGFEGIIVIVDVGGGHGATLRAILSKYPTIKGINFDLPYVIQQAPTFPGIEHVGGDMFESVPSGDIILLKSVIHDWADDECLKLLKNCWRALPETGKVVAVEMMMPDFPETDMLSRRLVGIDMGMLLFTKGKERTKEELEALGKKAGFKAIKIACRAHLYAMVEFYKKMN